MDSAADDPLDVLGVAGAPSTASHAYDDDEGDNNFHLKRS